MILADRKTPNYTMLRRGILSVISDEISDDFAAVLEFVKYHELDWVELRSAYGTSLLRLPQAKILELRDKLAASHIKVISFASPLLKWPCDRTATAPGGARAHGFALPPDEATEALIHRAFDICHIFKTKRLRVFSFLRHPPPPDAQLADAFETLTRLADEHDIDLLVEHEASCSIASVAEVERFLRQFSSPRIKLLLDPANFLEGGESLETVPEHWLPRIGHVHVKDYDPTAGEFVPLGEGQVPFRSLFASMTKSEHTDISISIETHCPDNRRDATARSLTELRRILSQL